MSDVCMVVHFDDSKFLTYTRELLQCGSDL
jgi:hypothetical protein